MAYQRGWNRLQSSPHWKVLEKFANDPMQLGTELQLQRQASVSLKTDIDRLLDVVSAMFVFFAEIGSNSFPQKLTWGSVLIFWYSMSPWTSIPGSRVACNPGAWNLALGLMWTALGAKISDKFVPGMGWSGLDLGDIKMQRICTAAVSFMLFVFVTFLHVYFYDAVYFPTIYIHLWPLVVVHIKTHPFSFQQSQ